MKQKTDEEIKQIWEEYRPLANVDRTFLKVQRNCQFLADLENRVGRALTAGPIERNPLREMATDRDEIMEVEYTYQGTDVADFFWNLFNWDYFQRQTPEKQIHLYRLAVVAGYFMEPEKMHPEMINAVRYADKFV